VELAGGAVARKYAFAFHDVSPMMLWSPRSRRERYRLCRRDASRGSVRPRRASTRSARTRLSPGPGARWGGV